MTKFKGTKGKWRCVKAEGRICIGTEGNIGFVDVWGDGIMDVRNEQMEANAKLIAEAPEMFCEIKETIIDLKILKNQIIDANKTNHLFDGMPELMEKWIDRKEQMLNKITQ